MRPMIINEAARLRIARACRLLVRLCAGGGQEPQDMVPSRPAAVVCVWRHPRRDNLMVRLPEPQTRT